VRDKGNRAAVGGDGNAAFRVRVGRDEAGCAAQCGHHLQAARREKEHALPVGIPGWPAPGAVPPADERDGIAALDLTDEQHSPSAAIGEKLPVRREGRVDLEPGLVGDLAALAQCQRRRAATFQQQPRGQSEQQNDTKHRGSGAPRSTMRTADWDVARTLRHCRPTQGVGEQRDGIKSVCRGFCQCTLEGRGHGHRHRGSNVGDRWGVHHQVLMNHALDRWARERRLAPQHFVQYASQ
jgi:hypothetical protein